MRLGVIGTVETGLVVQSIYSAKIYSFYLIVV